MSIPLPFHKQRRLLIIDPDTATARGAEAALSDIFGEICCVETPAEVVRALTEQPFDAILAEVTFPFSEGLSVVRVIRKMSSQAKLVVWSAYATEFEQAMVTLGVDAVLEKPVSLDVLKRVFKEN